MQVVNDTQDTAVSDTQVSESHLTAFEGVMDVVRDHVARITLVGEGRPMIFRTDVSGPALWEAYMSGFARAADKQYHNCNACKSFIHRFARLVTIDPETLQTKSVFVPEDLSTIHPEFAAGLAKIKALVEGAKVVGPFFHNEDILGTPFTHPEGVFDMNTRTWGHFAIKLPVDRGPTRTNTTAQNEAEVVEDFQLLRRGLGENSVELLKLAHTHFTNDADLKKSTHIADILADLIEMRQKRADLKNQRLADNLLWRKVRMVSKSTSHFNTSSNTLGNYLRKLDLGNAPGAKKDFLGQTDSKVYMRPKAAPTSSNVQRAEVIIAALGMEQSLKRRALRREEIPTRAVLWTPPVLEAKASGGVFGHLKTRDEPKVLDETAKIDGGQMSVTTFLSKVVPTAERIRLYVPPVSTKAWVFFTTALHEDAPKLFNWGHIDTYSYTEAMRADQFGITAGAWVDVTHVAQDVRGDKREDAVSLLVLAEGHDINRGAGAAIFPQNVVKELHEVRSTIESFSANSSIHHMDLGFVSWTLAANCRVTVYTNGGKTQTTYDLVNIQ